MKGQRALVHVAPAPAILTRVMRFRVFGIPGPQGSKRFVGVKGGKGVMVESSKKVLPWREAVKAAALFARGTNKPIDGPIVLRMVFTVRKPESAPKGRRTYPMRTPDLSKLARSTEDAMTDAGVWADDARIIEYQRLAKVFPDEDREALDIPGVYVEVWSMKGVS